MSVQRQRLFLQSRSFPAKPSGSTPAATYGPWITSLQLMTARRLRSIPNGWTGHGLQDNSFHNRKMRWSQLQSRSSGPRSQESLMLTYSSTSWRPLPRRMSPTIGPLPHLGPWLGEPSYASSCSSAAGESAAGQDPPNSISYTHSTYTASNHFQHDGKSHPKMKIKTIFILLCTF